MAIRVALDHHTQYNYDRMVFLSSHLVRLKPAAHSLAAIESYSLTIEPANHVLHWQQDPFGNFVARVDFTDAVQTMTIQVRVVARLEPVNPFDFFVDTDAATFPFEYNAQLKKDLAPYLEYSEPGPYLRQWVRQVDQTRRDTVDFLIRLNQQLYQAITYTERLQPGVQTAEETLQRAIGSCRDSGWLLVQILRQMGLAARFVSGYLAQVSGDDSQTDLLALHAWAEVYIPGAGWIGLDPTSGTLTTEGHIPLACTPQPSSAAPVSGTSDRCEVRVIYAQTLVHIP
ncbi:transglutaminase family protein [Larkinella terrae]|uniref:Transglutaminase n=1 Tax=Larkinella terrae TaxID=2025311 RepID=A0A7K0EIP9_9BACT|nr:transglutaminase family protein [Larkinella terrae]MRS61664.1 transglutaminase [Larkinella terrae]